MARPGNPSPDFRAWDVDGKSYTVADFRGKYVYIDLWATWCGPCRREMPFLKQLEEEYKGRNITFLSLSTDARKADWLKMVKSHPMTGMQLFLGTGSRFQTAYKADGIPPFHPARSRGEDCECQYVASFFARHSQLLGPSTRSVKEVI